jgi:high-affinity iron transporter
MFSTAIIIFREILEIAMIVGVVLAATRGVPGRALWVGGGFAAGCAGAGLVALFAETISSSLSGMGQEFFNAAILFMAAIFIGWTALWIRKNARIMTAELRKVGHDVVEGKLPHYALSLIIGLALLREGSEIVLFIYSMMLSGENVPAIVEGSIIGLAAGAVVGTMLYYGLLKIPARYVLRVTSWLLFLLVSGLASQGVGYLSAAGYFADLSQQIWNTSWLLADNSIVGKTLHTLVGYTARPTLIQLIVYVGMLVGLMSFAAHIDRSRMSAATIMVALATGLALFQPSTPAYALDEIYSPNTEEGELSLEYAGSRTFDNDSEKNNVQSHELVLEAGVTDRLTLQGSAGFEKQPQDHIRVESIGIEGRYQFFEQGKYWVDSGLLAAYGFSTKNDEPDSLELKLLLQKDMDKVTATANLGFEQSVGHHAPSGGPNYVALANVRYRLNEMAQPGIEYQADLGNAQTLRHSELQEHYLGPSLYGKLFGNIKYQASYLLGVSQAAANSAARIQVEYETNF